jgi:nitrate reductase NapE component
VWFAAGFVLGVFVGAYGFYVFILYKILWRPGVRKAT